MKSKEIHICECLEKILVKELGLGNFIRSYNEMPEWPKKDSRFIFLNKKLSLKSLVDIPLWVFVSINNDMHYTWYDEIYCDKHHDLLAAGDM